MPEEQKQLIREKLADIEHQRWAKWQAYLHSKLYSLGESELSLNNHLLVMPTELYQRWERQIATPYSELSEKEKESDREQVDMYFPIIEEMIDLTIKQTEERIEKGIEMLTHYYRSKYSSDCSRGETEEEKSTEMLEKQNIIALIRNSQNLTKE